MSDRRESLGTVLFLAAHVAAYTLLGITVHDATAATRTAAAAAPDTPLTQPDPPPAQDAA